MLSMAAKGKEQLAVEGFAKINGIPLEMAQKMAQKMAQEITK